MYCTKCGAKISDMAVFCTKCGHRVRKKDIGELSISEKLKEKQEREPNKTELSMVQHELDIYGNNMVDTLEEEKINQTARLRRNLIILAGILGVVATSIIIMLVWILLTNGRKPEGENIVNIGEVSEENTIEDTIDEGILQEEIQKNLEVGKQMLLSGDIDGALGKYEVIRETDNKYENGYLFGADIYLKQGDYNTALVILEEGYSETKSAYLKARKEYICKNVVISEVRAEGNSYGFSYEYDSFGNLIKEDRFDEWYNYSGWDEIDYNSLGNKVRCNIYDSAGDLVVSNSFGYDEQGCLVLQVDYDETGAAVGQHRYIYDSEGHQIECNDYNEQGNNTWNTKSEYDTEGRKIKDLGYNEKGKLMGWVETIYNSNGKISQMIRYDKDGRVQEWNETEYNEDGNVSIFSSYSSENELNYWEETEYDEEGNKKKTVKYYPDGSEYYWCEYDKIGKKVMERKENIGITYMYLYQYIGDILCESDIEPISGQLSVSRVTGYRRKPNEEATFVGMIEKGVIYSVIGENAGFYQVDQGWYFSKSQRGIQFVEGR